MPCLKSYVHRKYAHKKMTLLALAICLSISSGSAFAYEQVQIVRPTASVSGTTSTNIATDNSTTADSTHQFKDSNGTALADDAYIVSFGAASNVNMVYSVAVGGQAVALGDAINGTQTVVDLGNTAFGDYASANTQGVGVSTYTGTNGGYATAIGYSSSATNDGALAVGANAKASGPVSEAIGYNAQATKLGSTAIGYTAEATGAGAIAIGFKTVASANGAVNVGINSSALGVNTISIGNSAIAGTAADTGVTGTENAIAIGNGAVAKGANSTVLGSSATTDTYDNATAIGYGASAKTNDVAIGNNAVAGNDNSVALGNGSVTGSAHTGTETTTGTITGTTATTAVITEADGKTTRKFTYAGPASNTNGTVSVGKSGAERQIQNVAAGDITATSTDAVNGSQLEATNENVAYLRASVTNITSGDGIDYVKSKKDTVNDVAVVSGSNSSALGYGSSATGNNSTALGNGSSASAGNSTAVGVSSVASNNYSVAVGNGATASGTNTIALGGAETAASGNESISIGSAAKAYSKNSISIGYSAVAGATSTEETVAIGYYAKAIGKNSTALGGDATTDVYENATAVGQGAQAYAGSVAVGQGATAKFDNSMALGYGAHTETKNSVALGTNATTSAAHTGDTEKTITIVSSGGAPSTFTYAGLASDDMGTVSVGGLVGTETVVRQIQNVAAGDITATSTDAVNGSQLYATNANVANLTTRVASMSGGGTTTIDYVKSNKPTGAYGASVDGANSSALGYNSSAAGSNSTAVGNGSSASAVGATALGEGAKATTTNSVALGTASTTGTVNTGTATDTGTTATTAKITAADGTTSTFTYAGPASEAKGLVSVGSAGAERQIQNVAAGDITKDSTDAVNGSQLFATNTNVSNLTNRVGTDETKITNLQTTVGSGITFAGNTSTTAGGDAVALGKKVTIEGKGSTADTYLGTNIQTAETYDSTTGNSTIEIMMTTTPVFTSVTAGTFIAGGTHPITISGADGTITGLTNTTWDPKVTYNSGRAATEEQLSALQSQIATGTGIDYVKSDNSKTTTFAKSSGENSSALGYGSSATASQTTAVGNKSEASAANATALGEGAKADATNATAVGEGAQATADKATAIGEGAKATTSNSVALGTASTTSAAHTGTTTATGTTETTTTITDADGKTTTTFKYAGPASDTNGTVSVGSAGAERQIQNVAAGDVTKDSTDAVNGSQLYATDTNVSNLTTRVGTDETNITNLQTTVAKGITFAGNTSTTTGGDAVALGKTVTIKGNAKRTGDYNSDNIKTAETYDTTTGTSTIEIMMSETPVFTSVTAGTFTTSGDHTVTISGTTGTITGLTNTTWDANATYNSGRAATEEQLSSLQTQITNIKTGSGIDYVKSDNSKTTTFAKSSGEDSSALGYGSSATDSKTTAVGNNSEASEANATALGEGAKADATNATAVGEGAQATADKATALGEGAKATTSNSVALGTASTTSAVHTDASAQSATVVDTDGKTEETVAYAGKASATNGTVSVGSSGAERQIQNVAAGDVSASSTDAVNGSQLNATNSNVINLTTRMSTAETNILNLQGEFGGGITFTGNTGSKKADLNTTFNIQGEGTKDDSEYSGANIKTVVKDNTLTIKMDENPSFTSVTATSIIAGSGSSKVLINNTGISVGGNTYISSTGINANNQVITNVATGSATAGSTDAVNGTQLYETNQAVAKNAQDIANINNGYNILDNKIDKVGAGAAALAGLHPLEFDPTDRFSMSTGFGTYRGEHALAMGAFYRPTESTMYSVGSELGNSNNMWTVGVSFKFGADKTNPASRSNIVRELLQLKAENKAIKADNMAMKAELSEIKQQLALLIQKK